MLKKLLFVPAALLLLLQSALPTMGQNNAEAASAESKFLTNGDVLFSCDFQTLEESNQLFKVYDLSGLTPSSQATRAGFSSEKPWLLFLMDDMTSTNHYAGSHSWFEEGGQANAWLVSRRIDIPAAGYTLTWKSESGYVDLLDCLRIYISTQGENPSTDFTEKAVWESLEEPAGDMDGILDGEWNEHSLSLDAYAGKSIWIAFVNESEDKGIICIDDVKVAFNAPYELINLTEKISTDDALQVEGCITAKDHAIQGFKAYFEETDGTVHTADFSQITLQPGESKTFAFDEKLTLKNKGSYEHYSMWTSVEGMASIGTADSVVAAYIKPTKRVVLEEGTGTWCGNCPLGILAIDHLHKEFGDQFIPIAVHNGDKMTVDYYNDALACSAFPMGAVNRQRYVYPAVQTKEGYSFDGNDTFKHDVVSELSTVALWQPFIKKATLAVGNKIEIESETTFAINIDGKKYCIAYALTENNVDRIKDYQTNYFCNYTDEFFGEFASGGKYGSKYLVGYAFQEVARGIYPAFRGALANFPEKIEGGKSYAHSYTIDLNTANVEDADQLYVTMLLIDDENGCILNAHQVKVEIPTGIEEVGNQTLHHINIYSGELQAPGATSIETYDLAGRLLQKSNSAVLKIVGTEGAIVAKANYPDGSKIVKTVSVK